MLSRRHFLLSAAAVSACSRARLSPKERVDRALKGLDADRPPFTFWHHFGLEKYPAERHARATLEFHSKFRTDIVKVMSDFPYPKPPGDWYKLQATDNPYPEQIRALEMIRDGLAGSAYFVETIFNPWNVAEKLSSKEAVLKLKDEKPQALLDALEVITKSEAAHASRALAAGASGIFLAVANAEEGLLTREDYEKFSAPFDKMILRAAPSAPLNTLHLHGDKVYLDLFYSGWPPAVFHYASQETRVPIAEVRSKFAGVIMGGIEYVNYRKLSEDQLAGQYHAARDAAGKRFLLAPGCSVPNDTTDGELMRLVRVLGA